MGRRKGSKNKLSEVNGIGSNYKPAIYQTPNITTPGQVPLTTTAVPKLPNKKGVPNYNPTLKEIVSKTLRFGRTGTLNYGGYFQEEYLGILRGRNASLVYDEMRRSDYQVQAVIAHIMNKIRAAQFTFEPADPEDPKSCDRAEYVNHNIFKCLNKSWIDNLNDLMSFLIFGFAVFEPTWAIEEQGRYKGNWYIKDLGFTSQKTIWRWNIIDSKLWSVQQISYGDDAVYVDIPGDQLLVITNNREGNNLEGISILRGAYGPWFRKQVYHTINGIGIERNALGIPHITIPEGKMGSQEEVDMDTAMQQYSQGSLPYLKTPEGWLFNFQKNDYKSDAIAASIRMEDANIAKAMQAEFIEMGMTSGTGNRSLGDNKTEAHEISLKYMAQMICDALNKLGKMIEDANFGVPEEEHYCECRYSGIDVRAGLELSQEIKNLTDAGALVIDKGMFEEVRKIWNFPKTGEEDESEMEADSDVNSDDKLTTATNATKKGTSVTKNGTNNSTGELDKEVKEHGAMIKQIIAEAKAGKEKKPIEYAKEIVAAHREHEHHKLKEKRTVLTEWEKKVNFAEMGKRFNSAKSEFNDMNRANLMKTIAKYKVDLKNKLARAENKKAKYMAVANMELSGTGKHEDDITKFLVNSIKIGRNEAKAELKVKKLADDINDLPAGLYGWTRANAKTIAAAQQNALSKKVTFAAISALDSENSDEQVVFDAGQAGQEFIDNDKNLGGDVCPLSAESMGRYNMFQEMKDSIQGFQFSALMENTCDLCAELDESTFQIDDPSSMDLTPPLHQNCQCILVPILMDEESPDEWDGLDAAKELIDKHQTLNEVK